MKRSSKGFTLVELLVVIAIIGLLISILLPALRSARDAANRVACASGMKQFAIAFEMYINDNHGWLPTPSAAGGAVSNDVIAISGNGWWSTSTPPQWINYSLPEIWNRHYLASKKVARCPAFDQSIADSLPYWYAWSQYPGYMDANPPINTRGMMTYLYLPWRWTVYSLTSATWSGIYGQGGISIKTKWNVFGPILNYRNIAVLQDTVALYTGPASPPYTAHGSNQGGGGRPQGGNVMKGDWSVQWVPFGSRWTYVGNGRYNYVDLSD